MNIGKTRSRLCAVLAACLIAASLLPAFPARAAEAERVGVKSVMGWYQTVGGDFFQCDITFEKDILVTESGAALGYWITEKAQYAYLQEFIAIDGATVDEINKSTDTTGWEFKEFPSLNGGVFAVPVVLFASAANKLQIRIHTRYVGADSTGVKLSLLEGFETGLEDGTALAAEPGTWERYNGEWLTEEEIEYMRPKRDISVGYSQAQNWAEGGEAGEWKVFDLYFSRDLFVQASGKAGEYSFMDADFRYVSEYIAINGVKISDINADTSLEGYEFHSFPQVIDGKAQFTYAKPVLLFADTPNHLQFRIHAKYAEDEGLGEGMTVSVLEGLETVVPAPNEDASGYEYVRYRADAATFTKGAGETWTSSVSYVKYETSPEVIDRADIDFSLIDYEKISATSASDIIEYGDAKPVGGERRKNQYICVYFDRDISYQQIPYASAGKKKLSDLAQNAAGVNLTQAQVDSVYDYRIDLAVNDCIVLDGKTIREWKAQETMNGDLKLFVTLGGSSPNYFTIYIDADSAAWQDRTKEHTLEILPGFVTPLFGKTQKKAVYYYSPDTNAWTDQRVTVEEEITPAKKDDNALWIVLGSVGGAAVLAGAVAAAVILKKKGARR